ncbi:MAG: SDR family oxidoreductase [Chloroflexota bacterium]|nr:SDR family oxidoreductase [Chloroflexota bacterium]
MELKPLDQQVIVITGASSGIGRLTALEAARRGAKVVLAARGAEALEAAVQEITAAGGTAFAVQTDVADFAQVEALGRRAIERFGRIDTWVNNAAVSVYGEFVQISPEEFRRVIEIDLMGQVYGAKVALQHMRGQPGGSIINNASGLADRSVPLQTAYCAAKHGVKGFTEGLRVELDHAGVPIQVVTIKPGSIDTPFFQHAETKMGVEPKPVPPVYAPELVAEAILHAATHPTRDLPVGGASAGLGIMQALAPRMMDLQLRFAGYWTQQTDRPKDPAAPSNLVAGSPGPGEIYGGWNGWRFSLYTWLRLHPLARRGAFAGGALAGFLVARGRR